MLKQIKNLGLSLVIGSILITSVPCNSFADNGNPVMTPEYILSQYDIPEGETIVDIYGHIYDHNGVHVANDDGSRVEDVIQPLKPYRNINKMSEEDRVVEMYRYVSRSIYGEECSKKDEAMVRKYFKYRTIKKFSK